MTKDPLGLDIVLAEACCKKMRDNLENETIQFHAWTDGERCFYIRGKPDWVNDGDEFYDNMSSDEDIEFCPFCGKRIKKETR